MVISCYLQAGFVWVFYFAYVCTLFRGQILRGSSMPIQDYYTLNFKSISYQFAVKCLIRLLVLSIPLAPFSLLIMLRTRLSNLHWILSQLILLFFPSMLGALYMFTWYDKIVYWAQDLCGYNDEFE